MTQQQGLSSQVTILLNGRFITLTILIKHSISYLYSMKKHTHNHYKSASQNIHKDKVNISPQNNPYESSICQSTLGMNILENTLNRTTKKVLKLKQERLRKQSQRNQQIVLKKGKENSNSSNIRRIKLNINTLGQINLDSTRQSNSNLLKLLLKNASNQQDIKQKFNRRNNPDESKIKKSKKGSIQGSEKQLAIKSVKKTIAQKSSILLQVKMMNLEGIPQNQMVSKGEKKGTSRHFQAQSLPEGHLKKYISEHKAILRRDKSMKKKSVVRMETQGPTLGIKPSYRLNKEKSRKIVVSNRCLNMSKKTQVHSASMNQLHEITNQLSSLQPWTNEDHLKGDQLLNFWTHS